MHSDACLARPARTARPPTTTTHTSAVAGCMLSNAGVCGFYSTDIALRDEPLQGGIAGGSRTVGEDDGFVLDACASHDPDDPLASCSSQTGQCASGITFAWSCAMLAEGESGGHSQPSSVGGGGCASLAVPPSSVCEWEVGSGMLPAGRFTFTALIAKPSGEFAECLAEY